MNRNPRFLSLRAKLSLGFSLLAVLALGLTSYIYYQNTKALLLQDIRERLRDAVSIGALQVDAVAHSQLTSPSQEGQPTYLELKKTLQNIRDAGTGFVFVYTMKQDAQGNILFIVDAEEHEEDLSHLGDIYDDASPWLLEIFPSVQEPLVESQFYTDKWGTWLTGYAPIYTPEGRREAVLGIDIAADDVIAQEQQALWRSLLIFFGSIPLVALGGWLLGTVLSAPISTLTRGAEYLARGDFSHQVDIKTNDEIGFLGQTFNSTVDRLRELVGNLEQRVAERTANLEKATLQSTKRADELQTISDISRAISNEQELEILLSLITQVVSERFGFYHVGIFLVDETATYAILRASNSRGGQKMLERGHRLEIGQVGIVGKVAATGVPRLSLDVGEDAVYFKNPDLPETHSEIALPLKISGKIIGVLDVQSTEPSAFTNEDVNTLSILSDQIAIAIEKARLLETTRKALDQTETAYRQYLRNEWKQFTREEKLSGYQYVDGSSTPLETPLNLGEITPIINSGNIYRSEADLKGKPAQLAIPVKLREEVIGVLYISTQQKTRLTDDDIDIAESVAEHLALAIENARLFQASAERAARERIVSDVSSKISGNIYVKNILRTAAQELSQALKGSDVLIQIKTPIHTAEAEE